MKKAIAYVSKKEQLEDVETALLAVEIETLNAQWKVALQEVGATPRAISANGGHFRNSSSGH